MASRSFKTEAELITMITEWQRRLANIATALNGLQSGTVARLRKGGVAGSSTTQENLTNINDQINSMTTTLELEFDLLLESMFRTLNVTAVGAISDTDDITVSNVNVGVALARFFGVCDGSDIPHAVWALESSDFYLGTEVNPDHDLVTVLALAANDVVLVQDTDAATNDDSPTVPQKGRRLVVAATEDNVSRGGKTLFGVLKLVDGNANPETPHAFRDHGALTVGNPNELDKRLILRKVFDNA